MNSPKTSKRELTRKKVILAAINCIYKEGFHEAHTNKIAEAADVSWGVLQYHFGDKDGLLQAVLDYIFEDFAQTLSTAEIDDSDLHNRVRQLIDVVWSLVNKKEYRVSIAILRNAGKSQKSTIDGQRQVAQWAKKPPHSGTNYFQQAPQPKQSQVARRLLFATLRHG
ncbi:TetR/AcrR family transcriptional regulator [Oceanicoccus sp. KOV_DT_Chl]|uniref:TetR/AcrR family transcriptional regulator n=1 Tax=Oceanicoccus sp. KOV_DT_Chl TaxID=1904639 RepID=UPI000C7B7AE4|nr:TetR/AcrR family transcriptional regulator [Oceanicoccus sp. KOV_DT_Chl]